MKDALQDTFIFDFTHRQMPPVHQRRKPAPGDVWDLREYSTWWAEIWKLVEDFADTAVRAEFLSSPPEHPVGDDPGWLDRMVYAVHRKDVDATSLLAQRLRNRYTALRAVHGTRTANVASFYRLGLIPMVVEQMDARAHKIFLSGKYAELSASTLQAAIASVGAAAGERRVFFEAHEELLVAQAAPCMLFGSEYLTAIAQRLTGTRDYRQVLQELGQPTVFVCDVPLDHVDDTTLRQLASSALHMVFQELLNGPKFVRDHWPGAVFCIQKPLSPKHLVGHYHPRL